MLFVCLYVLSFDAPKSEHRIVDSWVQLPFAWLRFSLDGTTISSCWVLLATLLISSYDLYWSRWQRSQLGFLGTLWPSHSSSMKLFVKNCVSGSVYRSLILCRMLLLTHSTIVWRVEGMLISAKSELVSSVHVCIIRCNERGLGTAARILMQFKCDFPTKSVVAQWIRWRFKTFSLLIFLIINHPPKIPCTFFLSTPQIN